MATEELIAESREELKRKYVQYQMAVRFSSLNPAKDIRSQIASERPCPNGVQWNWSSLTRGCAKRWAIMDADVLGLLKLISWKKVEGRPQVDRSLQEDPPQPEPTDFFTVLELMDAARFNVIPCLPLIAIPKEGVGMAFSISSLGRGWQVGVLQGEELRARALYALYEHWRIDKTESSLSARDVLLGICFPEAERAMQDAVIQFNAAGFARCTSGIVMNGHDIQQVRLYSPTHVIPFDDNTVGEPLSADVAYGVQASLNFGDRIDVEINGRSTYKRMEQEILEGTTSSWGRKRLIRELCVRHMQKSGHDQFVLITRENNEEGPAKEILFTHRKYIDWDIIQRRPSVTTAA